MFYALNTKNKKILCEYQMNAAGSAPQQYLNIKINSM